NELARSFHGFLPNSFSASSPHAVILVIYKPASGKRKEEFKVIFISNHQTREEVKAQALETKEKLKGDNPVLAKYIHYSKNFLNGDGSFFGFENITKAELP